MVEGIPADRERVTVAAKDEHVKVRPRERHAAGEPKRATVNEMRAVSLYKVREPGTASDACHRADLLVMHLPLLNQLVIQREDRKVAAAGAPRRMIRRGFLLRERLAIFCAGQRGRRGCASNSSPAQSFAGEGQGSHGI